ncbi:hypothetical protein ASF04_26160 [Duganella sp. Leaf61]|nr:hypothetical protein ASF04_26160 [Duganella sp. Leaf61]
MELKDFLASVHAEVEEEMVARAGIENGAAPFAELVFTEIFARHMFERGMTFEPHACRFSATVSEGALRLSGYALSEDIKKLDLFVAVYNGGSMPGVLTELEARAAADQCGRFLNLSAAADLAGRVDETNDAYTLIATIASAWAQIDEVRIHVLTDLCAGLLQIPDIAIGTKMVSVEVVDIERVFNERKDVELQNRYRTLAAFFEEWMKGLRDTSEINGEAPESTFLDDVGGRLADAEEISDFHRCRFASQGALGQLMKIDGYAFDDADGSLSLVAVDFTDSADLLPLSSEESECQFAAVERFAADAIAGRMLSTDVDGEAGRGLAADIVRLRSGITRFRVYLASNRLFNGGAPFGEQTVDGLPVERHVWDAERFHRAAISESGRDDLEVDFRTEDGKGIPALHAGSANGEYQGYLCTISGDMLAAIYERHGSRLLEGNVRSFLSTKGKINAGIQTTLANQPEMFFAYNNGIAATAEAVEFEENSSSIKRAINFQIVNGGQTTASLATAFRDGIDLSEVRVQMKMSVLSPSSAGELVPLIARFANSQN